MLMNTQLTREDLNQERDKVKSNYVFETSIYCNLALKYQTLVVSVAETYICRQGKLHSHSFACRLSSTTGYSCS